VLNEAEIEHLNDNPEKITDEIKSLVDEPGFIPNQHVEF